MMDQYLKPKQNWCSFVWKVFSVIRVLKHLAVIWHHPFASLSVLLCLLLLFTPLMRPLVKFFFPLIAFTILCIIAFISFGFLVEQKESQNSGEVGDQISGWDILALGGGLAAFHSFQSDITSKQEDIHLPSLVENIKNANEVVNDGNASDTSLKEEIGLSSSKNPVEEIELMQLQPVDELDVHRADRGGGGSSHAPLLVEKSKLKQESAVLSSLLGTKKAERRKIRVRFVDEVEYLRGLAGDKHRSSDGLQSDTDASEDDDHSVFLEGSQEIKSQGDGSYLVTEEIRENPNYAADIEDATAGSGEPGQDTGSESDTHDSGDVEAKDYGLVSGELKMDPTQTGKEPELEIEEVVANLGINFPSLMEVEMDEELPGWDILSNFHRAFGYSGSKQKDDLEFEMEDSIDPPNVPSCDPNSSGKLSVETPSDKDSAPESEPRQEIESEALMKDDIDVDVSELYLNSFAKVSHKDQSDRVTEQKQDLRQERDDEIRVKGMVNEINALDCEQGSAVLVDQNLQADDTLKQFDDPKKDLLKWRDWIRGFEINGMSMEMSEKSLFKNVSRDAMCPDIGLEITGIVTLEEELTSTGAFILVKENEDTPFEKLGPFIQKLTEKLQASVAESNQKNGMSESADLKSVNTIPTEQTVCAEAASTSTMKEDSIQLSFTDLSPRAATPGSSCTEGDASSRWDEALDTSEKESVDSEIEEGRIWPAPESEDLQMVEQEFGILKFDCSELEKEYRALQDEIRSAGCRKLEEDDKASEEDLDPYVKLFAQTASTDTEAEVPTSRYLHGQHQASTISEKALKNELRSKVNEVKDRSILGSKGLFRKPRLSSISKAIKAIKGVKKATIGR